MTSRTYPKTPLVGVGAVVPDGNRVLLVRRAYEPGQGLWSVPGGLVEVGETVEEAVKREVEEETGVAVSVDRLIAVLDNIVRDEDGKVRFHYVLIDYLAHPVGGEARPSKETLDVRWVNLEDVKNLQLTKTALKLLTRAGLTK